MQPKQDMPMPREDNNILKYFELHKDKKYKLDKNNIKGDHRDLVGKNSNTESHARDNLSRRISQDKLLVNELLSSLTEVRFSEQEFPVGKPVLNIKYHHPDSQNNNLFYLFNDQLDYTLANYFAESEIIKSNIDRFLSNSLMFPFTEKLSYQNVDKWIEKLLDIPWGIPNDK